MSLLPLLLPSLRFVPASGKGHCRTILKGTNMVNVSFDSSSALLNAAKQCARSTLKSTLTRSARIAQSSAKHCQKVMKHRALASHQRVRCQEAIVTCRHCMEEMPRKRLAWHHTVCPQVKVSCPFHAHGCTDKIKRKDVTQHLQDFGDEHLKFVAASATQTKLENKRLGSKVNRLKKKIKRMEQQQQQQQAGQKPNANKNKVSPAVMDLCSSNEE